MMPSANTYSNKEARMKITRRQLREAVRKKLLKESSGHTIFSLREDITDILDQLREYSEEFRLGNHETEDQEGFTIEQGEAFYEFLEDAIAAIMPIQDQLDDMST